MTTYLLRIQYSYTFFIISLLVLAALKKTKAKLSLLYILYINHYGDMLHSDSTSEIKSEYYVFLFSDNL